MTSEIIWRSRDRCVLTSIQLTTTFDHPDEPGSIWRELFRGSRGLTIWDAGNTIISEDGFPGKRGRRLGPTFSALRGGLAALLMNSARVVDPIAVLYSPASLKAQWMLDHRMEGDAWIERSAEDEYAQNPARAAVAGFWRTINQGGWQANFIGPASLEDGSLWDSGARVLVLPHAIAMADREFYGVRRFLARGGRVVADVVPGAFDGHVRKRARQALADIFEGPQPRAEIAAPDDRASLDRILRNAGVVPRLSLRDPAGSRVTDVETHLFRNGDGFIASLQRDAGPGDEDIALDLGQPVTVHGLLGEAIQGGTMTHLIVHLHGTAPAVLSFLPPGAAALEVCCPDRVELGGTADLVVDGPGRNRVVHIAVVDPDGVDDWRYRLNAISLGNSRAVVKLPLALNDKPGPWRVRITDALTGDSRMIEILATQP